MHILVIHQFYLAPGEPGGSRFNEFARLWSEAGHQVTVVTGNLEHTTGTQSSEKLVQHSKDGAVDVYRCFVPTTYHRSYLGRAWAFAAFGVSSLLPLLNLRGVDVIVATSPPLTTSISGTLYSKMLGVPWIFEVRDLWPESAVAMGVLAETSPLTKALYGLERYAAWDADAVVCLTPAFVDDFVHRGLAPTEKLHLVPNGADTGLFRPQASDPEVRRKLGWGDRFVALYAGAHGRANALHQLIDAAQLLRHDPSILIACVGDGPLRTELTEEVRKRNLKNIAFHGPFPKEEMPKLINSANAGLAVLANSPTFKTVYPNKVFDYMACARPTVVAIDGVARTLVCDQAGAGLFANPEDGAALAATIRSLAGDAELGSKLGRQALAWVTANATRESLAARYLSILANIVRANSRTGRRRSQEASRQPHTRSKPLTAFVSHPRSR